MTPERWQLVKRLFIGAIEREPPLRSAFLNEVCGEDSDLRSQIELLMANYEQADAECFLEASGRELLKSARDAGDRKQGHGLPTTIPRDGTQDYRPRWEWYDSSAGPVADDPRKLGDYELMEEVGRGGMGVVYKARQVSLNRIVALKVVLGGELASAGSIERFQREAQAAANLDHPSIVPIYEVCQHEGKHYYSMGFVDGLSLSNFRSTEAKHPKDAARVVQKVAEAVHYAHTKGVIHRDLKPANILMDRNGQPRVTDFGLAKLVDSDDRLTRTGTILGTPSFMAPEQATGKSRQLGPAVDVYSLGATLYFLLTGQPPFQSDTVHATIQQVISQDPVPPTRLEPKLSRDLEAICLKCLEKEPQRRYASAAELAEDLARWERGESVRAQRQTVWYRTAKYLRRHRLASSLAAFGVMLVVVLVMSWAVATKHRARNVRKQVDDLRRDAYTLMAHGQQAEALKRLSKAQGLLTAFGGLPELLQQINQQAAALEEPVAARERFQRFERLRDSVLARAPLPGSGSPSTSQNSQLIRLCEQALEVYEVLQRNDWQEVRHVLLLDAVEREQLQEDVSTLSTVYFDTQHQSRIRGASFNGLDFQLQTSSDQSSLLPRIMDVDPDGPAGRAKLRVGDKILEIDGNRIEALRTNADIVERLVGPGGTKVSLLIVPNGELQVREVLVERDSDGRLGLAVALIRQLQVVAIEDDVRAEPGDLQPDDLLLSIDGQPAEGDVRVEDGELATTPFISCAKLLWESSNTSVNLLLLDAQTRRPKHVKVSWDPQRQLRCRRANMLYLAHNMRMTRGGIQAAIHSRDPDLLVGFGISDLDVPLETHLERYYVEDYSWPRDFVREAIPLSTLTYPDFQRGLSCQSEGKYAEAIREYEKELQAHPQHADSFRSLAVCLVATGQWDRAITGWSAYIALRPGSALGYFWRGRSYQQVGFLDQAEKDFRRSLELNPDDSTAQDALRNLQSLKDSL